MSTPGAIARVAAARLGVLFPTASARLLLPAAALADVLGIDQLWVGDPAAGSESISDDRYVLTTLAAIAAKTRDMRLGAFLHELPKPQALTCAEMLHVVEDLAVVDQASGGRLEVAFVPSEPGWVEHVARALSLWTSGWELGDGRILPVTPPPAQPTLPRLVVTDDPGVAAQLGGGRIVTSRSTACVSPNADRIVLLKPLETPVMDWLGADPVQSMQSLRREIACASAGEVLFVLGNGCIEQDLRALSAVVLSALHCGPGDVAKLTQDAWTWFTEGDLTWKEPQELARISAAFAARR